MLFYMNNEEGIKYVPSSFTILYLSERKILSSHPNFIKLSGLNPLKNETKEKYKQRIKDKSNLFKIIMIADLIHRSDQSNSVVLVNEKDYKEKYGFNYAKIICKIIKKRYGYEYFEFTNTITRDMRDASYFDEDGEAILVKDMIKLHNKIVNIRKG